MLFQCVENRRCVAVFISAVKRQIQNLFRRILRIKRIILRQLLHIFVRHRRFCCPPERKVPSPSVQDAPSPPDPVRAPYAPQRFRGRTPCRKSDTGKASLLIVPFFPCRCPSESFYYVYRKTAFPMQGIQRLIMYLQIGLPCAENRSSYSVMTFPSFKRASA